MTTDEVSRWNVFLHASAPESDERELDVETLERFAKVFDERATISGGGRSYGAGLVVGASDVGDAATQACKTFLLSAEQAGLPDWPIEQIEVLSDRALDDMFSKLGRRRTLVGVAELAQRLGVSRQRASELAKRHPGFPRPEAELASGPVWDESSIYAFVDGWDRSPGRRTAASEEGQRQRDDAIERYADDALYRRHAALKIIDEAFAYANLGEDTAEGERSEADSSELPRQQTAGAG